MTNTEMNEVTMDDFEARIRAEAEEKIAAAKAETERKIAAIRDVQAAYHDVMRGREEFFPADAQRREVLNKAVTDARRSGVSDADLKGWSAGPLAVKSRTGRGTSAGSKTRRSRRNRRTDDPGSVTDPAAGTTAATPPSNEPTSEPSIDTGATSDSAPTEWAASA